MNPFEPLSWYSSPSVVPLDLAKRLTELHVPRTPVNAVHINRFLQSKKKLLIVVNKKMEFQDTTCIEQTIIVLEGNLPNIT